MIWTLAATAGVAALDALIYGVLAGIIWRRAASGDEGRAVKAFALYWGMTSAFDVLSFGVHALAAAGVTSFALAVTVRLVGIALASVGVGGLMAFLLYLRTGKASLLPIVAVVYGFVIVLAWYHVLRSKPIGLATTPWSVDVAYEGDFNSGLFAPLAVMLLGAPILAAIWYATLAPRAADRRQRGRILAVGSGVALQLLSFLVARIAPSPAWELVSRVLVGLVVAALVIRAYAPRSPAALASPEMQHV